MGNTPTKNQPQPIDMNEALISMKMKGKQFSRESSKCDKERDKHIAKAKETLRKGNEEGARLFLELAEQKKAESMQYLRMSARLEHLAANIKSKNVSMQMVGELDKFTPILQMQAESMPIEELYKKMNAFGSAYDNLTVKGRIMDENMDKTLGEANTSGKVDQMLKELKVECQMDMGMVATPVAQQQTQQKEVQKQTAANDDFFNQLKNL